MLRVFFIKVGYILSFIFSYRLSQKLETIREDLYTGWIKRNFKSFEGHVVGKITLIGSQYISVGKDTNIQENVRLLAWDKFNDHLFSPEISIGKNVSIQKNCFISAINKIEIGNRVAITEHTVILDNVHGDFQDNHFTFSKDPIVPDVFLQNVHTRPLVSKGPIIIGDDVHIGMFSMILPNTIIGKNSIIAAHSVVSGKIPPYSLVSGNPARVILSFGRQKKKL